MEENRYPKEVTDPTSQLDPVVLSEYLIQLQANLDRSLQRSEIQHERIKKLESDREILRQRLGAARQAASRRGLRRFRADGKERHTEPTDAEDARESDSSPPEPTVGRDLTVATIFDPISSAVFAPEFRSIPLRRGEWRTQLDQHEPDLLFVESAFGGINGDWAFRIAHFGEPHADLAKLVHFARDAGIPTVFWNKEDPINYGMFIGSASLFDLIFTVDANSIERYQSDLGHGRVHVLPFAAQPALHFPPSRDSDRTGTVAFAGSYYAGKHPERRAQMEMLLGPALSLGLDIYDRMGTSDDPRFTWPDLFRSNIIGSVPYLEMGDVYRRYKVFLNVNTVTDSPTMCARRIFELAATGTPVLSGPSDAVAAQVPHGIVTTANSSEEAHDSLQSLLGDPVMRAATLEIGPRWIADGNTYGDRVNRILEEVS